MLLMRKSDDTPGSELIIERVMADISRDEFLLYSALALSDKFSTDIAILYQHKAPRRSKTAATKPVILSIAKDSSRSDQDYASSIVNALQQIGTINGTHIACTNAPSFKDLGMCRMGNVVAIFFPTQVSGEKSALKQVTRGSRAIGSSFPDNPAPFSKIGKVGNLEVESLPSLQSNLATLKKAARTWLEKDANFAKSAQELKDLRTAVLGLKAPATQLVSTATFDLPAFNDVGVDRDITNPRRDQIFMALAWTLVGEVIAQRGTAFPEGHNIGGVLRGPREEIVAWGVNTNRGKFYQHGEVNLIEYFQEHRTSADKGKAIGGGTAASNPILYTTLESCHMCAGMWASSGSPLDCVYSQKDDNISGNSLEAHKNGSSQRAMPAEAKNTIGETAAGIFKAAAGSLRTTQVLDENLKAVLLKAFNLYASLCPHKDAPGSPEEKIWENGLKLLFHVNPGIKQKWEARKDEFYEGVLP